MHRSTVFAGRAERAGREQALTQPAAPRPRQQTAMRLTRADVIVVLVLAGALAAALVALFVYGATMADAVRVAEGL